MGNRFICMTKKDARESQGSRSKRLGRSQKKLLAEVEFLHKQGLSMALHQHQLSQRFAGSMSRRIGSSSSRRQNLSDPHPSGKQVEVLVSLVRWSIFRRSQKLFFPMLQWCLMARRLLMCLLKSHANHPCESSITNLEF